MMDSMDNMLSTLAPEFTTELVHNMTTSTMAPTPRSLSLMLKVVYVIGILGNAAAIVALNKGEKRVRNRKHLLLLTTLAANDLVALVGMLCLMSVGEQWAWMRTQRAYCGARVVLRVFGIGSVCIAVTMALERYFALTRPFLYQKHVTYYVIRLALVGSWVLAALLTCAPVLGLGRYYCPDTRRCVRYRMATSTTDFVYAIAYVVFGCVLCAVLVICNLSVIRALYAVSAPRGRAPAVRRCSRGRQRAPTAGAGSVGAAVGAQPHNAATAEEVAFSRLMATLSVLFMICWLPQMVTSTLYLWLGPASWPRLASLGALSDVLMLLNYVLDPVLYVLMRRTCRVSLATLCCNAAKCCKRNHKTSSEVGKSSCCQNETMLVSESGAELKPLRAYNYNGNNVIHIHD